MQEKAGKIAHFSLCARTRNNLVFPVWLNFCLETGFSRNGLLWSIEIISKKGVTLLIAQAYLYLF